MPSTTHPSCPKDVHMCDLQGGPNSDCAQNLYNDDESDGSHDIKTPMIRRKAKGTPKKEKLCIV